MHISGGISPKTVNICVFLIHLRQEKVSFFESFRPQLLKIYILYSRTCRTWQGHVSDNAETELK